MWDMDVAWILEADERDVALELGMGRNSGWFLYREVQRQKKVNATAPFTSTRL